MNSNGLKIIGIFILVIILSYFKVFKSYFICNNTKCIVENKNMFGFTLSSSQVDIQNIDHFDFSITHRYLELNPLAKNNSDKQILYVINAVTKSGTKNRFFDKPSSESYYARRIVAELNSLIKDKNNLNINYSYRGD